VFQAEVVYKIKTRMLCYLTFFSENDTVWKNYGRAGQAIDANMEHAICLLGN
jgi:hypothetical protein